MLFRSAAIEAEKAGDAGRTFAVVAAEVKKLAHDTRSAIDEIGVTMDSLTGEGEVFVTAIQSGMARSKAAEAGFARINDTVAEVIDLVSQVDRQTDDIARSTSMIHDSVCRVGDELDGFAESAKANRDQLASTISEIGLLEVGANQMLDMIVHSGFAPHDKRFVDIAIAATETVAKAIEDAVASDALALDAIFDRSEERRVGKEC